MRSSRVSRRAARDRRPRDFRLALTHTAVIFVAIVIAGAAALSAHRQDELLQAARIAIEPDAVQIELDLTPGIALAAAIIADVDRNNDGSLSADEQQAYASQVLGAVDLEIDGKPLQLQRRTATFPDTDAMTRGEGLIRFVSAVALPPQPAGGHQLLFRNRHHPDRSVYLANALVPESDRVAVTAQRRDADQRELTIDYVVRAAPERSSLVWPLTGIAIAGAVVALLMRFVPARLLR